MWKSPRPLIFIWLIAVLPWLGLKDLTTRGEGREAIVAQSIIETGDWVLPRGYSNVIPSKPPFMHWLISAAATAQGEVGEFACRLPSAIAMLTGCLLFFYWLKKHTEEDEALVSVCILFTSIEWFRAGISCRVDMLLAACVLAALLSLYEWGERGLRGVPWVAVIALACGFLTKGPVAVVLPGAIFLVWNFLRTRNFVVASLKFFLIALAASTAPFIWYLFAYQRGGEAFWEMVYSENVQRFAGTMEDEPHKHAAPYLFAVTFMGLLPWSLLLLRGWKREDFRWPGWRRLGQNAHAFWHHIAPPKQFAILACLIWTFFFCIPSSKRSVYLLPIYPFLAWFLAGSLRNNWNFLFTRFRRVLPYMGVVILLGFGIIHPWLDNQLSSRSSVEEIARLAKDKKLNSYLNKFFGLSFYLHRPIYDEKAVDMRAGEMTLLYEDILDRLQRELPAGLSPRVLYRSANGIEKGGRHLVLVAIEYK